MPPDIAATLHFYSYLTLGMNLRLDTRNHFPVSLAMGHMYEFYLRSRVGLYQGKESMIRQIDAHCPQLLVTNFDSYM